MTKHPPFAPIKSSLFDGYHFDPATSKLTLKFTNGDVWQYDDVPHERAVSMEGSISPGRYFSDRIRGQYKGKKL